MNNCAIVDRGYTLFRPNFVYIKVIALAPIIVNERWDEMAVNLPDSMVLAVPNFVS